MSFFMPKVILEKLNHHFLLTEDDLEKEIEFLARLGAQGIILGR